LSTLIRLFKGFCSSIDICGQANSIQSQRGAGWAIALRVSRTEEGPDSTGHGSG